MSANSGKLHVPRTQTSFGDTSFAIAGPRDWNNLPDAIQDSSLDVVLNTRKTVEIIGLLVCLTTAAPVIFN